MEWTSAIDQLFPSALEAKETWDQLSEMLFSLLPERSDAAPGEAGQFTLRLKPQNKPKKWDKLAAVENQFYVTVSELVRKADKVLSEVREDLDDYTADSLITDVTGLVKDLAGFKDQLRHFMRLDDAGTVYWLEASGQFKSKSLQLYAVPVDVSPQLKEMFFDKKRSVILTSATLSVDKSFQFMIDQLGLTEAQEQQRLLTSQLPSPFNYREQALLVVPRDFPSVKGSVGDDHFVSMLVKSLSEAAQATKGRMLVLFTSYKMLRQVHEPLKEARLK